MSTPIRIPSVQDDDADDDDLVTSQHQCVACQRMSPATRTAHTISAQHGWRVARTPLEGGGFRFEWLCPPCWGKARQEKVKPL